MAFTDIFKKKKDKPDFVEIGKQNEQGSYGPAGRDAPKDLSSAPEETSGVDLGLPKMPAMPTTPPTENNLSKEIQQLSYKLDSLKTSLDNISGRLTNIENAIKSEPTIKKEGGEGWTY